MNISTTKQISIMIAVRFYKEENSILAVFPSLKERNGDLLCYSKIGQHSKVTTGYVNSLKEVEYNEYHDLLKELVSVGYNNLFVENPQIIKLWRNPTKYELKQGYRSTFHMFTPIQPFIKSNGDLYNKKKIAGLFYYR